MRISDWSSDVCSSDLNRGVEHQRRIVADIGIGDDASPRLEPVPVGIILRGDEQCGRAVDDTRRVARVMDALEPEAGVAALNLLAEGHPVAKVEIGDGIEAGLERGEARSDERRVGKEGVSTCRSRWSRYH